MRSTNSGEEGSTVERDDDAVFFRIGEGRRWLAYEAAFRGAPPELAATASAYALRASAQVFRETHQLSGAIGYTREHDLHVWSMRLQALRLELGGVEAHRRAVFHARWGRA